jgi:hypothetical protein
MADQTQRLEIATVRAEVGSNILYRFSNDPVTADPIPTDSGDIKNLKQEAANIRAAGQDAVDQAVADGIVDLQGAIVETQGFAEEAQISADRAAAAADSAVATGKVYPDTASGLAATEANGYFSVPSSDSSEYLILYKNVGGTAVEVKSYPSTKAVRRLDLALDDEYIPGTAWSVGDTHGSHPLRVDDQGVTIADSLDAGSLRLDGSEELQSQDIPGVAFSIVDSLNESAFLVKEDGTSHFASIDTLELMIGGEDVLNRLGSSSPARKSDMVMGASSLIPMYPDMEKISGWGSSSLEHISALLSQMFGEIAPSATYYSGAKGGETSRQIASRLGSAPNLLTVVGGVIPASGSVNATSSNVDTGEFMLPFVGTLSGVEGTLSVNGDVFKFSRAADGSAVSVAANTPFIPKVGPTYRDGVALLWMGKNDFPDETVDSIVSITEISFDYMTQFVKRILVIGYFADRDSSSQMVDKIQQANAILEQRYGLNYLDSILYVASPKVWTDTGITPTSADLEAQSVLKLPPSLTNDGIHFNASLNSAFVAYLKNKLTQLGWF